VCKKGGHGACGRAVAGVLGLNMGLFGGEFCAWNYAGVNMCNASTCHMAPGPGYQPRAASFPCAAACCEFHQPMGLIIRGKCHSKWWSQRPAALNHSCTTRRRNWGCYQCSHRWPHMNMHSDMQATLHTVPMYPSRIASAVNRLYRVMHRGCNNNQQTVVFSMRETLRNNRRLVQACTQLPLRGCRKAEGGTAASHCEAATSESRTSVLATAGPVVLWCTTSVMYVTDCCCAS
jgi:hypothetical protein